MALLAARVEKRVAFNSIFTAADQMRLRETSHIDVKSGELSSHGLAISIFGESDDIPHGVHLD